MTGWERPDMVAADNPWQKHWDRCQSHPCLLGCDEIPGPAVWARAAALAGEWAAHYRLTQHYPHAERAERSAAWLKERAEAACAS